MAHNIEIRNGKASIAYAEQTPWHRLGQPLKEAFTAETALDKAGLNFTVEKVGIRTLDDAAALEDKYALRRTDTRDVLGLVTGFYKPCQNIDAFGFFDGLFGKGKARYEVAGVLGKGERIWLLAKLPGDFTVGKLDPINKYLLLTNGHDGNEPIRAKFTPIRVVCQNTLTAALNRADNEIRIQHIGNVPGKLELAGKLMKSAGIYFDELQTVFNGFLRVKVKSATVRDYATRVLSDDKTKFTELSPQKRGIIETIETAHEKGLGSDLRGVRGSLWGAYNAVTEFIDHGRTTDIGYVLHGRGAQIKTRAFAIAQEIALAAN